MRMPVTRETVTLYFTSLLLVFEHLKKLVLSLSFVEKIFIDLKTTTEYNHKDYNTGH